MNTHAKWLHDLEASASAHTSGLVRVDGYAHMMLTPEQRSVMEKASAYGAQYVFFEASRNDRPPVAQALVFISGGAANDEEFARLHQRLWSWGGVPLIYRKTAGLVQLFRCAHKPDFEQNGRIVLRPFDVLDLTSKIATATASHPWWDAEQLRTGTLWDNPQICKQLLSSQQAAQKTLINAVRELHEGLEARSILPKSLRRRLLILSILIAYLEARDVFEEGFFAQFKRNATSFFEVLTDGPALLKLLDQLEQRFNGNVFVLRPDERGTLRNSNQLQKFARLVEGRQEPGGQLTLWQRYSFADLPVELISHIYQLFVKDSAVEVYTPHFVVRLMLGEVLSWDRLDRLERDDEVILDGACGSGIFLVEAYKRLILHWRYRNDWKRPNRTTLTKLLTTRLRGIDKEEGAVELAAFSLCLALCDALEPKEIRASIKLFPPLKEKTIHTTCFFEALEKQAIKDRIGVVVGNPPFTSKLGTDAAQRAYDVYRREHGALPDKQVAYLFLHAGMQTLAPGGVLCMLQQYNLLYNLQSIDFRRDFFKRWDVREILDLISVRGLFHKGDADTKVIVVVAEAQSPPPTRQILHATFRRTGRTDAEQGFEIDYYDMHWLPRELVLKNDAVWRTNLLGGGRVLGFVDRLRKFRTLSQFADEKGWDYGEGYIVAKSGRRIPGQHITGHHSLPSDAISEDGIVESRIVTETAKLFRSPYTANRFSVPMVLIHEQFDLRHDIWTKHYLTYQNQIVGFCAKPTELDQLLELNGYLKREKLALRAFVAATSVKLFTQHATTLSGADVFNLPYPESRDLDLSPQDKIIVDDVVTYYRDLVRLGEDSLAMKQPGTSALPSFTAVFTEQINGIYRNKPLRALSAQVWPGVICQPFAFGEGEVDWTGADELKGRLDALLREKLDGGLDVTRIARIYDGRFIFLLKPDRLRYWLRSVALRDADETLADLVDQGY